MAYIVDQHVDDRKGDDELSGRWGPGIPGIDDGDDELAEGADCQTGGQEDATTAVRADNEEVKHDGGTADADQDARVLKRLADIGHLEEVCSISCPTVSIVCWRQ